MIVHNDALYKDELKTSERDIETRTYKAANPRTTPTEILVVVFIWDLYSIKTGKMAHTKSVTTAAQDMR